MERVWYPILERRFFPVISAYRDAQRLQRVAASSQCGERECASKWGQNKFSFGDTEHIPGISWESNDSRCMYGNIRSLNGFSNAETIHLSPERQAKETATHRQQRKLSSRLKNQQTADQPSVG